MTQPSPAAQAALDAAAQAMECTDGLLPYERELMAAVLRAEAQLLHAGGAPETGDWLLQIAAKLEETSG